MAQENIDSEKKQKNYWRSELYNKEEWAKTFLEERLWENIAEGIYDDTVVMRGCRNIAPEIYRIQIGVNED